MKRFIAILISASAGVFSFFGSASGLSAKAVYVMDASNGRPLISKNPNMKVAPASTVKLITAMIVLDRAGLDDMVIISETAESVSPIKEGFKAGEKVLVRNLLYAALMRSANDASIALAEAVAGSEGQFVRLMNQKARKIGAKKTRFINSTGLPGGRQYTTASDMARIMRQALRYPEIREMIGTKGADITTEDGRAIHLENINKLLWVDEFMLGGKTGFTKKARHCFVFAAENTHGTIIASVMGARTRSNLWVEALTLIRRGFDMMEKKPGYKAMKGKNEHKG